MKKYRGLLLIAAALLVVSAAVFAVQFAAFHDSRDMAFYLLQDLAFLPIQILLVVVMVEGIIARQEKARLLHKMNMAIGTFFSDLGNRLLGELAGAVKNLDCLKSALAIRTDWSADDWDRALAAAGKFDCQVDPDHMNLGSTRELLASRRDLLTLLLANPNLMEHDRFTDLLWAVSHLVEELQARDSLADLPTTDRDHLAADVRRVYGLLTMEWLIYCRHLQKAYPYIFSLIARTHPLQPNPSATVR